MKQDPYAVILRIAQVMQEIEDKRGEMIRAIEDVTELTKQLKHAMPVDDFVMVLEDVAAANLDKLASRQERDVLHGNGDER